MAVHLTRIYTRTGDDGTTGLSDFSRVSKTDSRLQAYAECDAVNCTIGTMLAMTNPPAGVAEVLRRIQNELFDCGADLSTPHHENPKYPPLRITPEYIERLEEDCDTFNEELQPLNSFILPGGTPESAMLHNARVQARTAERAAWTAVNEFGEGVSVLPAKYLNRLSDLFFILARVCNHGDDVPWIPGSGRNKDNKDNA